MPAHNRSTYFFLGKLSDRSARYYLDNFKIIDSCVLEIINDGISVWGETNKPFDQFFVEIRQLIDTVVDAFVFKTKKAISCTLTNWIECTDVSSNKNMIGWIVNPHGIIKPSPKRSKVNSPWKKAVYLYKNKERVNGNLLLSLKDFRFSLMDSSEDSLFFCYRALEDVCRAVAKTENTNEKAWNIMHKALETKAEDFVNLTEAVKNIRHGKKHEAVVINEMNKKVEWQSLIHGVISKAFKKDLPKF